MVSTIISKPTDPRFIDLEGITFGKLKVLNFAGQNSNGHMLWDCVCDCGVYKFKIDGSALRGGRIKTCGQHKNERKPNMSSVITHGMSGSSEYKAYCSAKERCNGSDDVKLYYYGDRGIEFRFNSFEEFYNDIGPRPSPQHSLDRKDNNGHYEVGNVQWATKKQQIDNRRPSSEWVRY